uniref:Uncharacterized protein n=1 Tax=Panagrolaimus sp. JU765 TaxID=591449 RepID=A0AC34PWI3_9BILA
MDANKDGHHAASLDATFRKLPIGENDSKVLKTRLHILDQMQEEKKKKKQAVHRDGSNVGNRENAPRSSFERECKLPKRTSPLKSSKPPVVQSRGGGQMPSDATSVKTFDPPKKAAEAKKNESSKKIDSISAAKFPETPFLYYGDKSKLRKLIERRPCVAASTYIKKNDSNTSSISYATVYQRHVPAKKSSSILSNCGFGKLFHCLKKTDSTQGDSRSVSAYGQSSRSGKDKGNVSSYSLSKQTTKLLQRHTTSSQAPESPAYATRITEGIMDEWKKMEKESEIRYRSNVALNSCSTAASSRTKNEFGIKVAAKKVPKDEKKVFASEPFVSAVGRPKPIFYTGADEDQETGKLGSEEYSDTDTEIILKGLKANMKI